MPFQSEKQRRYLHANHPEIAKRWERDYAHGGILDINESEEIISDDGNDIQLTDYNAAFDDPNDFSTGVKSLFRAKDGGRIGFYRGSDRHEGTSSSSSSSGPGPGGQGARGQATQNPGTSSSSSSGNQGSDHGHSRFDVGSGYYGEPTTTPSSSGGDSVYQDPIIELADRQRKEDLKQMANTYEDTWGKWNDKYDKLNKYSYTGSGVKKRAKLTDQNYNEDRAALEKKFGKSLVKKILGAIVLGMPISIGYNDIKAVKSLYDLEQKYRADMGKLKQISIDKGWATSHHAVDTPFQTIDQLMIDTIRVRDDDDTGDDGPIYAPLTGEVSEEYAQGMIDPRDWMAEIRARQAIYQNLKRGWENQQLNSGGLANLFRVKNQ